MTNAGAGWGIWVSNDNGTLSLTSLELTAGETYTFAVDLITLVDPSGHNAGIKIELPCPARAELIRG